MICQDRRKKNEGIVLHARPRRVRLVPDAPAGLLAFPNSRHRDARYFTEQNWMNMNDENTGLLRWPDVVVCARLMGGDFFGVLRDYNPSAAVVYDIDDDLFDIPPENVSNQSITALHQESMRTHLANADLVTVSTPALAERLKKYNGNIAVLPNCIPQNMLGTDPIEKDHVRVGWAGSVTHVEDVEPAIQGLLMALDCVGYEKMRPVFMGFLGARLAARFDPDHTYFQKPVTIDQYYPRLYACGLDIGLAPIRPNLFNECKSAVKFYEYTAVGAATIASDVGPYKAEIKDGHRGLLVRHNSPEAWRDAVLDLYHNARLRKALANNARTWCRMHRDPEKWAVKVRDIYEGCFQRKGAKRDVSIHRASADCRKPSLVVGILSWVPEVHDGPNQRLYDLMQCLPRVLARITWPNVKVRILDQNSCADASWHIQREAAIARSRGLDVEVIHRFDNLGIGPGINFLFRLIDSRSADYYLKIDNDVIPPHGFDTIMMKAYQKLEEAGAPIGMLSLDPAWGPDGETFGTRNDFACVDRTEKINGHDINWLKKNSTAVGMCRLESSESYWKAGGHPDELKYGTDQIMADRFTAAGFINAHLLPYISTRPGVKPVPCPLRHIGSTTEERKAFKKQELRKMTKLRESDSNANENDAGYVAHR